MPEARYLKIVPTQMAKAHDTLLQVLIRNHESEAKEVGCCVAHE
jgi:hypothetical protein